MPQANAHSVSVGIGARRRHSNARFCVLSDMENGQVADMVQLGILESFHLKLHVVSSAAEAAEMVLRIDNIIRAPPRQR